MFKLMLVRFDRDRGEFEDQDLFHADYADRILETRISGFKDLEDINRSGMNRIKGILGI